MGSTDILSTPRRTQAQRRQETHDRLIAAGIQLFAEQGFAATTLSQIGERAGYSRETVRQRFGSKLALLEAAVSDRYEQQLLATTRDQELTGLDQALGCADALAAFAGEDPTYLQVVCLVNFESIGSIPEFRAHSARFLQEAAASIAASLRRGIQDGTVHPEVDCEEEAEFWVASAIGILFRWAEDPTQDLTPSCTAWTRRLRRSWGAPR